VLGSAVRRAFDAQNVDVLPLSLSRSGDGLVQVDLTDKQATSRVFEDYKPDCGCDWPADGLIRVNSSVAGVIHCAAERKPDAAERDPARAREVLSVVPLIKQEN